MRLAAFRVKNFRSIQDSGRCDVSAEDVAVLVGQNEAGKSSVLEGLMAYEDLAIHENDIRSDGSLPKIECEYDLSETELRDLFNAVALELCGTLIDHAWAPGKVSIYCDWFSANTSDAKYRVEASDLEEPKASLIEKLLLKDEAVKAASVALDSALTEQENLVQAAAIVESAKTRYGAMVHDALEAKLLPELPFFVLFNDEHCLLPSTIDIVAEELQDVDGKKGAQNFLTMAGLDLKVLLNTPPRYRATMLATANKLATSAFQEFWTQEVGKTQKIELECDLQFHNDSGADEKRGQPYLVFYISEANDKLYPSQRSKGVRWFLSFFLQIWASAKANRSVIFLLDEPGSNLHSKAQEDVLKIIERSCKANQVIYSTHSPDLIRADKLGRVLAVQRENAEDSSSPTSVISAHRLSSASVDTMSAVYRAMGVDFSHQQVIKKSNNVLLEEISALYYLKAFSKILDTIEVPNFLPATGATNIPMIANLLMGWGIEFLMLLDDDSRGREIKKTLTKTLFFGDDVVAAKRILRIEKCKGIEDLFEPEDFGKYVLGNITLPQGTVCSSTAKDESKGMLAYRFYCKVAQEEVQAADLHPKTLTRASTLLSNLSSMLNNYPRD